MSSMPLWKSALLAIFGSIMLNLILVSIFKPFVGTPATFGPLTFGPLIMFSILGAIGATVVYALLRKFTQNPNKSFTIVAAVVLVLSFIPDFLVHGLTTGPFAGATWSAVVLLLVTHIVEAGLIVYLFTKQTALPTQQQATH